MYTHLKSIFYLKTNIILEKKKYLEGAQSLEFAQSLGAQQSSGAQQYIYLYISCIHIMVLVLKSSRNVDDIYDIKEPVPGFC